MERFFAVLILATLTVHSEEFTDGAGITWYYIIEDGGASIYSSANANGAVSIPSELNGIPVKRITAYPNEQVFGWGNSTIPLWTTAIVLSLFV